MKSLCFTIYPQAWTIINVNKEQWRWIKILADHIMAGQIVDVIPQGEEIIHYGLFPFQAFRKFMQDMGYSNAVESADIFYNAKDAV